MATHRDDRAEPQQLHWDITYSAHPKMYGEKPSAPAVYAAKLFRNASAQDVVELGAGHGRDALFFAREGFAVHALDFSASGLQQLGEAARAFGIGARVTTTVHDARTPLPLPDSSTGAVFAHMLLCMALSTEQIYGLVGEVRRVLRPGGVFVYTVRHTGDAQYGAGISHGDNIFEHDGFAVHFFTHDLVTALADGWTLIDIHAFEEGELLRRLWRITQMPAA
jgi:SAM-dependent methyltransferase